MQPSPIDLEPRADARWRTRLMELVGTTEDSGLLQLFSEPRLVSLRLPQRPHPVACSFSTGPAGAALAHFGITLDLQIGGLSARALAVTGKTTMAEADIIGSTLIFSPRMLSTELPGEAIDGPETPTLIARDPGKGPRALEPDEVETLAFALHALVQVFRASKLSPTDLSNTGEELLEITVRGNANALLAGDALDIKADYVPFAPILMPTFPSAPLNRSVLQLPQRKRHRWILHLFPLSMSCAETGDTIQLLLALDALTGEIVSQGAAQNGSPAEVALAFDDLAADAGYRPGSAITTSPRLDEILGEGLQGARIRYQRRRRLKASDPRVAQIESYMDVAQFNLMRDYLDAIDDATGALAD